MRAQTSAETPDSLQLSCTTNIDENNHAQYNAGFSQLLLRAEKFHDSEALARSSRQLASGYRNLNLVDLWLLSRVLGILPVSATFLYLFLDTRL